MKQKSSTTPKTLAAQIAAITGDDQILAERPPDCITVLEYAAYQNISDTSARQKLGVLVKAGKMRRFRFKVSPHLGVQWGYALVGGEK
jgi:hypothetical protein